MQHNILSARYAAPPPDGDYGVDADVIAVRASGVEEVRKANDDIDGGGMLAFLAEGKTIAPFQDATLTAAEIADIKTNAIRRVAAKADELGAIIAGISPKFEELSWSDKRAAAQYVQNTLSAGETPTEAEEPRLRILTSEMSVTGETLEDLCSAILSHVDVSAASATYYDAAGLIAGQRRVTYDAINALDMTERHALEAAIQAILDQSEQQALTLLASLNT